MNAFYKEQKKLMEKALQSLLMMEGLDGAAKKLKDKYPEENIEKFRREQLEPLKTDYALTVTTLMQNFCTAMGFTLTKAQPEIFNQSEYKEYKKYSDACFQKNEMPLSYKGWLTYYQTRIES